MFYNQRDGPFYPTLQVLHMCTCRAFTEHITQTKMLLSVPTMLPGVRVDRGAIRFVFSGANVMAPGLTNDNVKADNEKGMDIPEGAVVVRYNQLSLRHLIAARYVPGRPFTLKARPRRWRSG